MAFGSFKFDKAKKLGRSEEINVRNKMLKSARGYWQANTMSIGDEPWVNE